MFLFRDGLVFLLLNSSHINNQEYLEEQYIDILRKVIKKELGPEAKLEYNVVMQNNSYNNNKPYTVKFPAKSSKEIKTMPKSNVLIRSFRCIPSFRERAADLPRGAR